MGTLLVAIFVFSLISQTRADDTHFTIQASVPVTISLPAPSTLPCILMTSFAVSASLASCALSPSPTLLFTSTGPASIVLSNERLSVIADRSGCTDKNGTSLFFTLYSATHVTGTLSLTPLVITTSDNSSQPHQLPATVLFSSIDGQYTSFLFHPSSVGTGIVVNVSQEYGGMEVFLSHCSDLLGSSLGTSLFPSAFSRSIDVDEWIRLMEESSCPDTGPLYHDLDKNPPVVIIRIRSANSSGVLTVSEGPSAVTPRVSRSLVDQSDVTLEPNQTFHYEFAIDSSSNQNITFNVKSGLVSLFSSDCPGEVEPSSVGVFSAGSYAIPVDTMMSTNESQCSNSSSTIYMLWRAEAAGSIVSFQPAPPKKPSYYWWIGLIAIAVAAVLGVGVLLYMAVTVKMGLRRRVNMAEERENNTYNIPMTTSWM